MNLYGVESTDDVQFDPQGLPVGTYKVVAKKEEPFEKEGETLGVIVTYAIVDGQHKGHEGKVWYCTLHSNETTANIARQAIKRIAEATGKPITQTAPIQGREMTLVVDKQKKNPDYTEVKKYLPADHEKTPF